MIDGLRGLAPVSALALGLALAGCGGGGGGGGGVVSTPTSPTYTAIADMTGNRTFQIAGVQYNTSPSGFTNGAVFLPGSGMTVSYTESSDSYQVSLPGGQSYTFTPANLVNPQPQANTIQYRKASGTVVEQLTLIAPTNGSVPLRYTVLGTFLRGDSSANPPNTVWVGAGGSPTIASDMPRTGTANYTVAVGGSAASGGSGYNLSGNSTATFSANFGAGTVALGLTLAGTPLAPGGGSAVTNFGTFSGNGNIAANSPAFSGVLAGTAPGGGSVNGNYAGSFFGPQAAEVGFAYVLTGSTFSGAGAGGGTKP